MCCLRMAVMHLPTKFCANSSIQSELLTFSELQDGSRSPKSCTFGTFRHVNSVVLALYISLRSTHLCSRRLFDDVTRINFRFLLLVSAWQWCIFPYNLMQYIFIQSKVIEIFPKLRWRPPPPWIFSLCEFGHSGVLTVWYLCTVPNLVQIPVIVTEIDAHMLQTFI